MASGGSEDGKVLMMGMMEGLQIPHMKSSKQSQEDIEIKHKIGVIKLRCEKQYVGSPMLTFRHQNSISQYPKNDRMA